MRNSAKAAFAVLLFFPVFLFATAASADAGTVCLAVLETPALPDTRSDGAGVPMVREATSVWEGGALEALFDGGSIVCNRQASGSEGMPGPRWGLADASDGGADFLLVFLLRYAPAGQDEKPTLLSVLWRLQRVTDGVVLEEGDARWTGDSDRASVSAGVAARMQELMKRIRSGGR